MNLRSLPEKRADWARTHRGGYELTGRSTRFGTLERELTEDERRFVEDRKGTTVYGIDEDELEVAMHEVADKCGAPPTSRDMDKHGRYAARTYVNRFESWNNAVKWAGYEPNS